MSADTPRLRLGIVGVVALSLFAALFARLWFLQVLTADGYELAARVNAVRVVPEPAPRGRILDRNGLVLVDNRASNVVAVDRTALEGEEEREELLGRLSAVLNEPVETLRTRLDDQRVHRLVPVPLASDVPNEVMAHLRERQADYPAVVARRTAVRTYPHGTLAAHILGYVGEINDTELAESEDRYRLGDRIGKSGIERVYEDDLRGRDGETRFEVDAMGRPVRVIDERPPVQGADIVLSIDLEVQREAEAALAAGLEEARGMPSSIDRRPLVADAGALVALDAKEGTVVAMASYPTFDPRELVDRITPDQAEFLFGDASGAPFTNRATQGTYAPGSTWKLMTASAGLHAGVVTPQSTINDTGSYQIPNCSRGCLKHNAGGTSYGPVDMSKAMAVSSNVYFYDIGAKFWERRGSIGEEAIQDEAHRLGIGERTGVEIGGESAGRIATPASRQELHEENPDAFPEGQWFIGDNVNLAIGQGELAITPIQLANAYAAFATGTRHAPNLVLRVEREVDGERRVVREVEPRVVDRLSTPSEVWTPIMDGLRGVVTQEKGTARRQFEGWPHDVYPVAAKTGTGQAGTKQDTALFAAVAPATDPRYSVSVVMEQSGFGASAAAPAARRVLGVLSGLEVPEPPPADDAPEGTGTEPALSVGR